MFILNAPIMTVVSLRPVSKLVKQMCDERLKSEYPPCLTEPNLYQVFFETRSSDDAMNFWDQYDIIDQFFDDVPVYMSAIIWPKMWALSGPALVPWSVAMNRLSIPDVATFCLTYCRMMVRERDAIGLVKLMRHDPANAPFYILNCKDPQPPWVVDVVHKEMGVIKCAIEHYDDEQVVRYAEDLAEYWSNHYHEWLWDLGFSPLVRSIALGNTDAIAQYYRADPRAFMNDKNMPEEVLEVFEVYECT